MDILKATLYPKNKFDLNLIRKMLDKAYWPLYGQMNILDEINCSGNEGECPEESGIFFSYIALMVYMVWANVLLLNLLIAMFRLGEIFY